MMESTKSPKIPQNTKNSVILRASRMALGTFSSRILGLIREIALAAFFDRSVTDAWSAAFRLPNLLRRVLGEGGLSISLQPVLIQSRLEDEKVNSRKFPELMGVLHSFLIVSLTLVTLAGILGADPLLRLILDSRYVTDTPQFLLTLYLARIMFGFFFFISLYAYYGAILNSVGSFGWPAAAPILFNVSLIISTLIPQNLFVLSGEALAGGVLIGGLLQMGILLIPLAQRRLVPGWQWNPRSPELLKALKQMLPGLVGLGVLQISVLINTHYASSLGQGGISYFYWADRLLELPLSLISVSLGTALLPTLTETWLQGNKKQVAQNCERYLSLSLFVAMAAAAGLFVLAQPIVQILFQRGEFTGTDTSAVASILKIYALILIPLSSIRVLVPSYYAAQKMWWPALCGGAGLITHIVMASLLAPTKGLQGITWAYAIGAFVNMSLLLLWMTPFLTAFPWKKFSKNLFKTLCAGGGMIGAGIFLWDQAFFENLILRTLGVSVALIFLYAFISLLLRHPEISDLKERFFSSTS